MNKLIIDNFALAIAASVMASAINASAAPLPAGTRLSITQGVGSALNVPCTTGSCFGMEVQPGYVVWTDYGPGSDGGIVIGKAQKSGGQELAPNASNTATGEMTNAWYFFGTYGTFFTYPGGNTQNIFDNAPCAGASCIGKTDLKVFNVAWNGYTILMGSAAGCTLLNCTPNQQAGIFVSDYQINPVSGGAWSMNFSQVVPATPPTSFVDVKFQTIIRGSVLTPCDVPPPLPVVENVNLIATTGATVTWVPVVHVFSPCGTTISTSCRIAATPANGAATVAGDCSSGTYQSNPGFVGIDSFTYVANNGFPQDSAPGTVTAVVTETPPNTACTGQYPVSQFTQTGKAGTLSITFTGNITSHTNKEVEVCPGTPLSYQSSSTQGAVICKVKNNTTRGSGSLKINDHLKCTDKPAGKDKVQFKVKSGIT